MAYEKRGVRPFETMDATQTRLNANLRIQSPRIPDGFQPLFGNLGLTPHGVDDGSIAAPGGTVVLSPDQYKSNSFGLYFGVHEDDWLEITRAATDDLTRIFGRIADAPVNLLVTVTNTRLNLTQVILDVPATTWLEHPDCWRWNLVDAGNTPTRPRPMRMPHDGCVITVQFVLREEVAEAKKVAGRPWRKGSWLAKVRVRVAATKGSGLSPRPLTTEIRELNSLGDHCTSFLDFHGEFSGFCFLRDLSDVLTVYIDEELLAIASRRNSTGVADKPASKGLINRWVLDTYRSLVHILSRDDQLSEFDVDMEDHRYSFTYQLLSRVNDYSNLSYAEALNVLRENPDKFIALLEGSMAMRSSDSALMDLRS